MANLGEIAEIVNASELTLEVGSDDYILLENLDVHVGRTENRSPTTGAGPVYTFGQGDNFFTCTLLLSTGGSGTGEFQNLNTLTQIDANGDMTSTAWKIVAKDVSGNTKTMAADGVLRDYDIRKPAEGKVEIDIFVRITGDTVSIT